MGLLLAPLIKKLNLLKSNLTSGVLLSQFLLRVLTSWVQAIDTHSNSSSESGSTALPSNGPMADWWPSLCLDLGSLLQVNPDILRRHLVCELYNQGLDLRAEQVQKNRKGC